MMLHSSFDDLTELQRRIDNIKRTESRSISGLQELPVICFDALLPRQRLNGSTSDPTFCQFLVQNGIGGHFVMVSLNNRTRKLLIDGVVCKLEVMDAVAKEDRIPTAVDFSLFGLQRCRVVTDDGRARVGRWRRGYDPDGEESRLGWGEEVFLTPDNAPSTATVHLDDHRPATEWSTTMVQLDDLEDDDMDDPATVELASHIPLLLDEWQELAGKDRTYENTSVVATARVQTGQPGLYLRPAALLRNVRAELGPIPSNPTDLALYGAALINPLPALGVSPEIRGRVLAASSALRRLEILEWGINRSMRNLRGERPL